MRVILSKPFEDLKVGIQPAVVDFAEYPAVSQRPDRNDRPVMLLFAVDPHPQRAINQALQQVAHQIDRHPLLTLAIAAGIGFLAGMSRRPD